MNAILHTTPVKMPEKRFKNYWQSLRSTCDR